MESILIMTIPIGTKMPLGNWFYKVKAIIDKDFYPKYGQFVDIEFRVNDGNVDIVAVVEK